MVSWNLLFMQRYLLHGNPICSEKESWLFPSSSGGMVSLSLVHFSYELWEVLSSKTNYF